jgi:hypothetical protein
MDSVLLFLDSPAPPLHIGPICIPATHGQQPNLAGRSIALSKSQPWRERIYQSL